MINTGLGVLSVAYILFFLWFLGWIVPITSVAKAKLKNVLIGITSMYTVVALDSAFWVYVLINSPTDVPITPGYLLSVIGFTLLRIGALVSGAFLWKTLKD